MYCGTKILTLASFFLGAVSVGTLSLSVATDYWLFMTEPVTQTVDNITVSIRVPTHSGLWKVCTVYDALGLRMCSPVPFKSDDDGEGRGRIDGQDTSMAIQRNNRISVLFPVTSLILMVFATVLGIIGNMQSNAKTLLAAVGYIVGALLLAVGIILYISAINDEVGHRMKSTDNKESGDESIAYWYGWSFFFAGTSFITSMLTAVVLVTLYLKRNSKQEDMMKIIPGLDEVLDSDQSNPGTLNPTVVL